MWLKDTDTLVWFSKRTVGGKRWHKLSLRGVTSVNVREEEVYFFPFDYELVYGQMLRVVDWSALTAVFVRFAEWPTAEFCRWPIGLLPYSPLADWCTAPSVLRFANWPTLEFCRLPNGLRPDLCLLIYRRLLLFDYWSSGFLPIGPPLDFSVCLLVSHWICQLSFADWSLVCRQSFPFAYWSTTGFCRFFVGLSPSVQPSLRARSASIDSRFLVPKMS